MGGRAVAVPDAKRAIDLGGGGAIAVGRRPYLDAVIDVTEPARISVLNHHRELCRRLGRRCGWLGGRPARNDRIRVLAVDRAGSQGIPDQLRAPPDTRERQQYLRSNLQKARAERERGSRWVGLSLAVARFEAVEVYPAAVADDQLDDAIVADQRRYPVVADLRPVVAAIEILGVGVARARVVPLVAGVTIGWQAVGVERPFAEDAAALSGSREDARIPGGASNGSAQRIEQHTPSVPHNESAPFYRRSDKVAGGVCEVMIGDKLKSFASREDRNACSSSARNWRCQ